MVSSKYTITGGALEHNFEQRIFTLLTLCVLFDAVPKYVDMQNIISNDNIELALIYFQKLFIGNQYNNGCTNLSLQSQI